MIDIEKSGVIRLTEEELESLRRGELPDNPVVKDWNLSLHELEEMLQSGLIIITK